MSSLFAPRVLLFAGECLFASTLVLGSAWLAASLLRNRASLRHLVWLAAFATLLVLPAVALIVTPRFVIERRVEAPAQLPSFIEPASAAVVSATVPPAAPTPWQPDMNDAAIALFVVWLAGACWVLLRLAVGAFGLAALHRHSRPYALDPADLPKVSNRRECELRLSMSQAGPITWGFLRPVILLPKNSVSWSRERLQAVLLHELAHVRRRDSLTRALSLVACALYWPNPLIWVGARLLRREAEIAADDAVLAFGIKPSAYAGELLRLAAEFRGQRVAFSGVSMAGSALEARVKSVLAPNQSRTGVTSMDALKIACLGFAAASVLAFARPDLVDAQTAPVPPTADAAPVAPDAARAASDVAPPVAPVETMQDDATDATPADQAVRSVQVRTTRHKHDLVVEKTVRIVHMNQAQIEQAEMQAHMAEAELAKVEPEIERAIAAAKIDEKIAKAMQDADPKIRADVARALAKAQPEIRRAIAEAHISERVARALQDAQPKIDAAIAKARKADEGRRVIRIEEDGPADATVENPDAPPTDAPAAGQ
jgi:beta-lactamase regulating signal transducer with metallopeptidase domain